MTERTHAHPGDGEYTDTDTAGRGGDTSAEKGEYTDVEEPDGTASRGDDDPEGEYTDAEH